MLLIVVIVAAGGIILGYFIGHSFEGSSDWDIDIEFQKKLIGAIMGLVFGILGAVVAGIAVLLLNLQIISTPLRVLLSVALSLIGLVIGASCGQALGNRRGPRWFQMSWMVTFVLGVVCGVCIIVARTFAQNHFPSMSSWIATPAGALIVTTVVAGVLGLPVGYLMGRAYIEHLQWTPALFRTSVFDDSVLSRSDTGPSQSALIIGAATGLIVYSILLSILETIPGTNNSALLFPQNTSIASTPIGTSTPFPAYYGNWQSIFSDPFDSNSNNWQIDPTANSLGTVDFSVANGKFHWMVNSLTEAGLMQWIPSDANALTDCFVSVTGRQTEGASGAKYGLVLRFTDAGSYTFWINEKNGTYDFFTDITGTYDYPFYEVASSAIRNGDANTLSVKAEGGNFSLYINGVLVNQYHTDLVVKGQVGLVAVIPGIGKAVFDFDDFNVYGP
jgi:hypothetical protein